LCVHKCGGHDGEEKRSTTKLQYQNLSTRLKQQD